MILLPNEILAQLTCSSCKKYLSVKPIKIYPGGIIKCGRCNNTQNQGILSLYNELADYLLFRCINRYDGCKIYLCCEDVINHEQQCRSEVYKCPYCHLDSFCDSALHFLIHFKRFHKDNVLIHPVIKTPTINNDYYLFENDDLIFVLYVCYHPLKSCITVNAFLVMPHQKLSSIKYRIEMQSADQKVVYRTPWKICSQLWDNFEAIIISFADISEPISLVKFEFFTGPSDKILVLPSNTKSSTDSVKLQSASQIECYQPGSNKYLKIHLSKEFKETFPEYYLSPCQSKLMRKVNNLEETFPLTCSFCENPFIYSKSCYVYASKKYPYVCSNCAFDSSSNRYVDSITQINSLVTNVCGFLLFYCKFCPSFYSGSDLLHHEKHCRKNTTMSDQENSLSSNTFFYEYNAKNCCEMINIRTRDDFKYQVFFKVENSKCFISTEHNYNTEKFCIVYRIYNTRNSEIYEKYNTFSICISERIYVAILLKEIKDI